MIMIALMFLMKKNEYVTQRVKYEIKNYGDQSGKYYKT